MLPSTWSTSRLPCSSIARSPANSSCTVEGVDELRGNEADDDASVPCALDRYRLSEAFPRSTHRARQTAQERSHHRDTRRPAGDAGPNRVIRREDIPLSLFRRFPGAMADGRVTAERMGCCRAKEETWCAAAAMAQQERRLSARRSRRNAR